MSSLGHQTATADVDTQICRPLTLQMRAGQQRQLYPEDTPDPVRGQDGPRPHLCRPPPPQGSRAARPRLPWYWALKPRCRWLPSDVKCSRSQFLLLMTGAGRLAPVNLWGQEDGVRDHSCLRPGTRESPHCPCVLGPPPRPGRREGRAGPAAHQ